MQLLFCQAHKYWPDILYDSSHVKLMSVFAGSVKEPNALSTRFIVGFWWMYVVVFVAVYNGNLISFLTMGIEFVPFESLNEMVEPRGFNFGFLSGTTIDYGFMSGAVYKELFSVS